MLKYEARIWQKPVVNHNWTSHKYTIFNVNKWQFDDFLACLLICSLCNIFAYGNAYAYKYYEYSWKLAYSPEGDAYVTRSDSMRRNWCRIQ